MKLFRLYTLQSKFILGLITIIMVISIINLTALYFFMQKTLEEEVATRAEIVLHQADSIKSYVRETLRPKMYDVLDTTFVVEAMSSSFISRNVMEKLGGQRDYEYRRVAINARNTQFEARPVEVELIEFFRKNSNIDVWRGRKNIDGNDVFVMARPVTFTASCLHCHGDPDDAPAELLTQYGNTGYNHQENSIDGIDFVGVPTSGYSAKSDNRFGLYVTIYLFVSGFLLFLIYLTFQRVVAVNFRILSSRFRKNFQDQKGAQLLKKIEHGDELEEMIEGMEGLSQHLYDTEQQLKEYTAGLEEKVEERTRQLSLENEKRRQDFSLFVDILRTLRKSKNRVGLWKEVLPILANSLKLRQASYICTFASNLSFNWPLNSQPILPEDHFALLLKPEVRLDGDTAFIPVGSSDEAIEGILHLVREDGIPFTDEDKEQLTAVGRQLGIAAENLAALDALLRETDNLQTIVEGITDPLILMDRSGTIIMSNSAATELLGALEAEFNTANPLALLIDLTDGAKRESNQNEVVLENGRSFLISTFPLPELEDQLERIVVAIHENTERKKMLQQVVQSEKMATVGKLAAGLAHEINNPLGVILCYAELLGKSLSDEQIKTDIDIIIKHTRQAQSVLLDLLNFSRPKVATEEETVLGEVTESVIAVFQVQAGKKDVTLRYERMDAGKRVKIEPQAVEHIVLNLLINSLDATKESGEILVRLQADESRDNLILTVEDSGTGIDPEILDTIFDPFFTTKDVNSGTGLGLAVIYGYMNEIGGKVEARNRDEGGAIFELTFPAVVDQIDGNEDGYNH